MYYSVRVLMCFSEGVHATGERLHWAVVCSGVHIVEMCCSHLLEHLNTLLILFIMLGLYFGSDID